MAKQVLFKEYVYFNFPSNEFKFYNVEVLSVGYNELQVIVQYGKIGNKGNETINRMKDFKEAMKLAYKKIYDKKAEGYISKAKMVDIIQKGIGGQKPFETSGPKNKKKRSSSLRPVFDCSECHKSIKEEVYHRINEWARGEGNWDGEESFVGYQKVLCIDCQIEYDIFKKKVGT